MKYPTIFALALAFSAAALIPAQAAANTSITSELNGKCIDVSGARTDDHTPFINWDCHGGKNQSFEYNEKKELRVMGKCMDARSGKGRKGDPIILYRCHGGENQKWTFKEDGTIRGINGLCVDVAGGNKANGAKLHLWTCHNGANQKWKVSGAGFIKDALKGTLPPAGIDFKRN